MMLIELEDKIMELVHSSNYDEFIFNFLRLYDIPNSTISKLQKGTNNLSKNVGEIHLKNKLYFKETTGDVFSAYVFVENLVNDMASKPRYLFITDYKTLLAKDTKTGNTLDIPFTDLPKNFDFFLAWNNIEKVDFDKENPADIKAAERFARIYDELVKENQNATTSALNLFLIRLLFCLFAEDTGIFEQEKMFTNDIKTLSREDGSDLNQIIRQIFEVLDKKEKTSGQPSFLNKYPYVNGRLFSKPHEDLKFSKRIRKLMIDAGELLNWATVNPDILGSMIQTVATDSTRSHLGMHYTSVPNIMKVINPLFLEDLKSEFYAIEASEIKDDLKVKKLEDLLVRIGKIKFFDPACGSGNFLIITYKEMRRFEMNIYEKILELKGNSYNTLFYMPYINLSQFYGIEIDDFAHDVAMLSLWIADHQMNLELNDKIPNNMRSTLPLQKVGDIRCANALRIDWNEVCPHEENDEVYIFGNPPYLGARIQKDPHKQDMAKVFGGIKGYKQLDYISAWFYLGALYSKDTNTKIAFVSTNSITQGEQVSILWGEIFNNKMEISFAYQSFKWGNSAKNKAGVTVVIIGLFPTINPPKQRILYGVRERKEVKEITPYLTDGKSTIVRKHTSSISQLPTILFGSMPNDGGHLILSREEYQRIIETNPTMDIYIKEFLGADEFLKGIKRYCFWIEEKELSDAIKFKEIQTRIEQVKKYRLSSTRKATQLLAEKPYSFGEKRYKKPSHGEMHSIIIPNHSSENRLYVPMGILEQDVVVSNAASVIYDAPIWLLGILQSRIHMIWLREVGGGLETRYRYSAGLVYNTFPVPKLSTRLKNEIEEAVMDILDIRDEEGGTLDDLYGSPLKEKNPKPMNKRLQLAHEQLDRVVEKAYRSKPFENDEERLEVLLSMYQERVRG